MPASSRRELLAALPSLATLSAVAGAGVFATIWWGYVSFYSHLGLTPQDVGLSEADVVRTTALAIFLLVAFATPVVAVWWLGLGLLAAVGRRAAAGRPTPGTAGRLSNWANGRRLRLTAALVGAVVSGLVVLHSLADFVLGENFRLYTLCGVAALLAAIAFSGLVQRPTWTLTSTASVVWIAAFSVVLLCALSFWQQRGGDLADNLVHGDPPYYSQFIFQIEREPVCVGTGGHLRPAVLLGDSGRGVVLLDRQSREILRPASRPDMVSRPSPSNGC